MRLWRLTVVVSEMATNERNSGRLQSHSSVQVLWTTRMTRYRVEV